MEIFSWVSLAILNSSFALSLPAVEEPLAVQQELLRMAALPESDLDDELEATETPCHRAIIEKFPCFNARLAVWTEAAHDVREGAVVYEDRNDDSSDTIRLELRPGPVWSGLAARLQF